MNAVRTSKYLSDRFSRKAEINVRAKERARLRKLAFKLWRSGALRYLQAYADEIDRRILLDGDCCISKKTGQIVDPKCKL